MSRVDFYLLNGATASGKILFAARLAGKIYRLGHRAFLRARDEAQARTLDDLLWTFDQSSFIPHALECDAAASGADAGPPVVIGWQSPCDFRYDVLISLLEDDIPDCWGKFERVAEIVDGGAADKQCARDRFRRYRSLDCEVATHEITL